MHAITNEENKCQVQNDVNMKRLEEARKRRVMKGGRTVEWMRISEILKRKMKKHLKNI